MKQTKQKPKYNTLQSTAYMCKLARKYERAIPFHCLLMALLFVGQQLTELYIAPTVLSAVERHVPLPRLFLTIAGFTLLLLLLRTVSTYLNGFIRYHRITLRMFIAGLLNRKGCDTSYVNRFDKKYMDLKQNAGSYVGSNSGASEAIWDTLTVFLQYLLGIAAYAAILASVSLPILLVILATALVSFFTNRYLNAYEYRHREELAAIERKLWYVQGAASGDAAKDIRIFGLGNWLEELYQNALSAFRAFKIRSQKVYLLANVINLLLTFFRNGFAYAYLIHGVLEGGLSASEFLLYFNTVGSATWWITDILNTLGTLRTQSLGISTIREALEYPEPFKFEDGRPLTHAEGQTYELKLENVSFRYPGTDRDVLKNISLAFRPGEKLAVVGLNGAGKTTLVKVMTGLLDPTEGRVTLNGVDIRDYDRRDYYKLFSAVFQHFSLLPASVAENVAQSNGELDEQRVKDCLARAGLLEKISSLPEGIHAKLNRHVYEEATALSGGETQRLMLARALYKDAPFLMLDEPTAALDPIAESEIYEAYNEMTAGKSAVFISHRLASTRFCNRILLLQEGVIAEEGSHRELMTKGGIYADLFAIQSKYYREEDSHEQQA